MNTASNTRLRLNYRWPASVRPVTPVRPVDRAGQVGGYSSRTTIVQRALVTSLGPGTKTPPKHNLHGRRILHKANQNTSKIAKNRPATTQPKNTRI
jgi:hypothetical protein